jgi:hypothetical protein
VKDALALSDSLYKKAERLAREAQDEPDKSERAFPIGTSVAYLTAAREVRILTNPLTEETVK